MTEAAEHRLAGFEELLASTGEEIVVMDGESEGATVVAVVNRGLDENDLEAGHVDFTERNQSRIELLIEDVEDDPPGVGKSFKDSEGDFHRIKSIKRTDFSLRYMCEMDPTDE